MSDAHFNRKWWHPIEEGALVLILALMTIITFANVMVRVLTKGSILWSLEAESYLFAWLVLLGLGYLVRTKSNLGVDAVINIMNDPWRRLTGIFVALCCIAYALLMMRGAYDQVANYYNLPTMSGRVIPTGFDEMKPYDYRGYVPVDRIPMPDWLRPIWEPLFLPENEPPYQKLAINIPYLALIIGVFWMLCRFVIAFFEIWRGVSDRLIASHEVEEAIEAANEEAK